MDGHGHQAWNRGTALGGHGIGGDDTPNSVVLAQAIEAVGQSNCEEPTNVIYEYLLEACEKVFANELDQATFEEHMRWFFRTKVCGS